MDLTKLKPGDTVWHVERLNYEEIPTGVSVTVKKVGRVWITLDGGFRFYRKTWLAERTGIGHGNGVIYRCQQDYIGRETLKADWRSFVGSVYYYEAPNGMTLDKIRRLKEILSEN